MHRLDNHIRDIEPRIEAIYNNVPKQEEASLQESLSSYGWILLDSWIAWRTLRFVLKDANISQDVNEKWFQTPSSYTASQLKAIWRFNESNLAFLESQTGKNLKTLIDQTIQLKRNSSAHFTQSGTAIVTGQDAQEIKRYYKAFSKVFLLYELNAFLIVVAKILLKKGYQNFEITFDNGKKYLLPQFTDSITEVFQSIPFQIICEKDAQRCFVNFSPSGCCAGIIQGNDKKSSVSVINAAHDKYDFFSNKGYYLDADLFIETIEKCWVGENESEA